MAIVRAAPLLIVLALLAPSFTLAAPVPLPPMACHLAQDDAASGGDAPASGDGVDTGSASWSGCLGGTDGADLFWFPTPEVGHVYDIQVTAGSGLSVSTLASATDCLTDPGHTVLPWIEATGPRACILIERASGSGTYTVTVRDMTADGCPDSWGTRVPQPEPTPWDGRRAFGCLDVYDPRDTFALTVAPGNAVRISIIHSNGPARSAIRAADGTLLSTSGAHWAPDGGDFLLEVERTAPWTAWYAVYATGPATLRAVAPDRVLAGAPTHVRDCGGELVGLDGARFVRWDGAAWADHGAAPAHARSFACGADGTIVTLAGQGGSRVHSQHGHPFIRETYGIALLPDGRLWSMGQSPGLYDCVTRQPLGDMPLPLPFVEHQSTIPTADGRVLYRGAADVHAVDTASGSSSPVASTGGLRATNLAATATHLYWTAREPSGLTEERLYRTDLSTGARTLIHGGDGYALGLAIHDGDLYLAVADPDGDRTLVFEDAGASIEAPAASCPLHGPDLTPTSARLVVAQVDDEDDDLAKLSGVDVVVTNAGLGWQQSGPWVYVHEPVGCVEPGPDCEWLYVSRAYSDAPLPPGESVTLRALHTSPMPFVRVQVVNPLQMGNVPQDTILWLEGHPLAR